MPVPDRRLQVQVRSWLSSCMMERSSLYIGSIMPDLGQSHRWASVILQYKLYQIHRNYWGYVVLDAIKLSGVIWNLTTWSWKWTMFQSVQRCLSKTNIQYQYQNLYSGAYHFKWMFKWIWPLFVHHRNTDLRSKGGHYKRRLVRLGIICDATV